MINGDHWTWTPSTTSNRLASAADDSWSGSYNYDLQGNLLGTAHPYWAYDSFGRMRTFTPLSGSPVTTYDVNPEGQRLRKYTSLNSTWFAPDVSGTLMAEDQDGTWSDYVWLNGKLVAMIRNGNVYSVHTDQTGRPEGMTNSQGTVIWRAKNFAFDREVTAGQASDFNIGFPGQYFDEEGGLYYNGARDYSPGLGRYIESDPIGLAGGINTYVYAENNPISNVDPSGLCKHKYNITVFTLCSAADAFGMLEAPGMSAPGSPRAQEGFTQSITLWGNNGNNRISQYVNSSTMTIVNTALPGHEFYPGTVAMQVTPGPFGFGSVISITGQGNGANPLLNDAAGYGFFGLTASEIALLCNQSGGLGQ